MAITDEEVVFCLVGLALQGAGGWLRTNAYPEPSDVQVLEIATGAHRLIVGYIEAGHLVADTEELAALCAKTVHRVIADGTRVRHDGKIRALVPEQIGIAATHRRMITAIELALPANLRSIVRVDTPERWQGLEVDLMLSVHPLSGVVHPSDFDLDTGRLCVMASRHKAGLLILTRDHIARTLDATIPSARQPVGIDDVAGIVVACSIARQSARSSSSPIQPPEVPFQAITSTRASARSRAAASSARRSN